MSQVNLAEIASILKDKIQQLDTSPKLYAEGEIMAVHDGIVMVYGLAAAVLGEKVVFESGGFGLVLNLEYDMVGVMALTGIDLLSQGQKVSCTGDVLSVPVGEMLLGRVVNALGEPIDGKGAIQSEQKLPIERIAPSVIAREPVNQPLLTGYKSVDVMLPIGRGQRELIIGDRQTGKTALALDAIINQRNSDVFCVYVAIGQKQSTVAAMVEKLKQHDALSNTIILSASAAEAAAMQYIAPYAGCAMGEYFRDRGQDALIVYDDLSKHAVAYRQISLLLRRPPGREAYPGDIFYLHSRLLERAARVNVAYVEEITQGRVQNKTGSLTALPIIETQGGDFSAFVPTNVVSITDGQIFLETNLFNAGIRPAVNAGISVSRVGGAAQKKIIKKLGSGVRLALAQYRELAAFSQFASDLDKDTKYQLDRGKKVLELMKQKQYSPFLLSENAAVLFAIDGDYIDQVKEEDILRFEKELLDYAHANYADIMTNINQLGHYDDQIKAQLKDLLDGFIKVFNP